MEIVSFDFLPKRVFSNEYEKFIFLYYDDFFNRKNAALFFNKYYLALEQLNIQDFNLHEIKYEQRKLNLLKSYNTKLTSSNEIAKELLVSDFQTGMSGYFTTDVIRSVVSCSENEICIYFERDLEAIVIGCTNAISRIFLINDDDLRFMEIDGYIEFLDQIYLLRKNEEIMINIKEQLLLNYQA